MRTRAPRPKDAEAIAAIVRSHGLPREWIWPEGKHGLVAVDDADRVIAFAILNETIWGLVIEELWEEPTTLGLRGLGILRTAIERVAQTLADTKGEPLMCGGVVRLDRDRHIRALKHRGYSDEAVILSKTFTPRYREGLV